MSKLEFISTDTCAIARNKVKEKYTDHSSATTDVVITNIPKRKVKIKRGEGYVQEWQGTTACILEDFGDGVTIKFDDVPEFMLDYSQLDYLRKAVNAAYKHLSGFEVK